MLVKNCWSYSLTVLFSLSQKAFWFQVPLRFQLNQIWQTNVTCTEKKSRFYMTGLSGINYSLSILIKLYTNLIILIVIEAWRIYRRYLDFKPVKTSSQSTRNINNNNTTQTAAAACRKVKKWVCSETGREDDSQRKIKTEMLFAPLNAQHVMSATRGLTIKTRVDFIVIIHYNNITT